MSVALPRILLVDDLEANRFLLEEALADIGAEIFTAESGLRALDLLGTCRPDVVLLDFQMPELNGVETTRRIKQAERSGAPFTFVILTSGYREAEDAALCEGLLADRFLGKPYALDELRNLVGEGLRIARERRAGVAAVTS